MTSLSTFLDDELSRHVRDGRLFVTITGSGGKTTTMERLARMWASQGYRVLALTSTRLLHPSEHSYDVDRVCLVEEGQPLVTEARAGEVVLAGTISGKKIGALPAATLGALADRFDRILVEGDGARSLPLKIHSARDPVVPPETMVLVALAGLSAFGKPLDEQTCHMPQRLRELTGWEGSVVDASLYLHLLEHPEGLLKGRGDVPALVLLNQADVLGNHELRKLADVFRPCAVTHPCTLVLGSWHQERTCAHEVIGGFAC